MKKFSISSMNIHLIFPLIFFLTFFLSCGSQKQDTQKKGKYPDKYIGSTATDFNIYSFKKKISGNSQDSTTLPDLNEKINVNGIIGIKSIKIKKGSKISSNVYVTEGCLQGNEYKEKDHKYKEERCLSRGYELVIEKKVTMGEKNVFKARRILVKSGAHLEGTLEADEITIKRKSSVANKISPLGVLPLPPTFAFSNPGEMDVINKKQKKHHDRDKKKHKKEKPKSYINLENPLAEGRYRNLKLRGKSTLELKGGFYHFRDFKVGSRSTIKCLTNCIVLVKRRFHVGKKTTIEANSKSHLDFSFYIEGGYDKEAKLDKEANIKAIMYSLKSTLKFGKKSKLEGIFIGNKLRLGKECRVTGRSLPEYLDFSKPEATYVNNIKAGKYEIWTGDETKGKFLLLLKIYQKNPDIGDILINFSHIYLNIKSIHLTMSDGKLFSFNTPASSNLLAFENTILHKSQLEKNKFTKIRIDFDPTKPIYGKQGSVEVPIIWNDPSFSFTFNKEFEIIPGLESMLVLNIPIESFPTNDNLNSFTPDFEIGEAEIVLPFVPGYLMVKLNQKITVSENSAGITTGIASLDELIKKHSVFKIEPAYGLDSIFADDPIFQELGFDRIYKFLFRKQKDVAEAQFDFLNDSNVEKVMTDAVMTQNRSPNDTDIYQQWYLRNIQADKGWNITTGDDNILIAVVDTGVNGNHDDLGGRMREPGYGFYPDNCLNDFGFIYACDKFNFNSKDIDPYSHGTHVTGIIAAIGYNGQGIAGVNWKSKILPIRVAQETFVGGLYCGSEPVCSSDFHLSWGIRLAALMGAKVINVSMGGPGYSIYNGELNTYTTSHQFMKDTINYAKEKKSIVIASAGNYDAEILKNPADEDWVKGHFPASFSYVISVGATRSLDKKAIFSNFGNGVDISAPGSFIYSTIDTTHYTRKSGTSMATPIVTGLASLMLSIKPDLSRDEILQKICDTSETIDSDKYLGCGRINIYNTLKSMDGFQVTVNLSGLEFSSKLTSPDKEEFFINLYEGRQLLETINANDNGTYTFDSVFGGKIKYTLKVEGLSDVDCPALSGNINSRDQILNMECIDRRRTKITYKSSDSIYFNSLTIDPISLNWQSSTTGAYKIRKVSDPMDDCNSGTILDGCKVPQYGLATYNCSEYNNSQQKPPDGCYDQCYDIDCTETELQCPEGFSYSCGSTFSRRRCCRVPKEEVCVESIDTLVESNTCTAIGQIGETLSPNCTMTAKNSDIQSFLDPMILSSGENYIKICAVGDYSKDAYAFTLCKDIEEFSSRACNATIRSNEGYIPDATIPGITTQTGIIRYLNDFIITEIDIVWKSNRPVFYSVRINGDCTAGKISTGTNAEGFLKAETYLTSKIISSELNYGDNTISICAEHAVTGEIGTTSYTITKDTTPPVTALSPDVSGGIFSTPQTVTLTCSDNYKCESIVFTTDGTDPDFISSGLVVPSDSVSISVGSEFDGLHTVKFLSRDMAGNIETAINTVSFSVYSTIPEVTAKVDHNFVSASGGYPQGTIEWTTNVDGFYEVKYKGNCETGEIIAGANTNGNVNLDVPILTVIDADELIQGTNTLYICVENLAGLKGSGAVAITLDNDAPTLTIEPPPRDDYNTPQVATIGCTEKDCEKIIYSTDNSEPAFDPNGEISNGILYAAGIVPPDQAKTIIKYSAIDYAGNVSPVQTASYTIDTITPEINIVSGLTTLSIGDGIGSTELIWNTSRSGLEYTVRIGGTDCQSGQTSLDNGRSGTTAAGDISTTILAEELELGQSTIRICVANLIGHYGSETHTITRVENPPSLTLHSIDRKFLSLNPGFDLSNISWESNQSGDFAFKFKGNCETGETLPGATNSGTINANEEMLSVINATDINTEGTHAIFICVINKNNLSSELIDIIFLDKTPSATSVTPRGGVFAKAKEVTLECTDNNECDSIVYTLDGTMPEFYDTGSGNGTEIAGNKIIMTIGSGSNGIYPLIFKSRDTVRNVESLNSINFYIDNTVPDVTINSLDHRYISNNGYVSATIIWQSDRDGSYSVKVSGDCALGIESTGLNPSGAVLADTPIESEILAGDLFPGKNTIRICVTSAGKTAEQTETITLDDTAPQVFANPGEGAYGMEQEVTISCSDNCLKIAYTEDGTDPQFDAGGNITNGIEYTTSWLTPTWQSTMLKYRAFDLAGNASPVQSSNYVIDDRYPTVSLVLKQRDYVSINSAFNSSDLIWNVDYKDLDYAVKIGGTGCTDGALSSGSGGSGKTLTDGNIVSTILANDLAPNEYNKVRICAKNLIPNDGEYDGYTTVWIKRHDEEPNLIVGEPQYSTLSSKGYDQTLLVWTSDLDGDYIIKINGDDCDSGTTSSGAGSVGQVYSGNSISTTIKEADLDPGINTIRICVNGRNGLQKSAVLSITKDETGPTITVLNEGSLKVHLSTNGRSSSILNWNSDSTGIYSIRKGSNCVTGDLAIAANSSGPLPTDFSSIENTIYADDLSDLAPGVETNILICVIKESNGTSSSNPISFYRDDIAPQVVTWIPTGTEVKLESQIMVDFDKELDPATVTLANIELSNPLAGIISGTYSYASNRIIFIPSGLDSNKDYIFTVYSGVTDLYGNHISQHEWSFHTEISNLWRKAIWSKSIWTIP